jgi:multidrug efflux pump subunit AcrB
VIALGMLVDNAVVISENFARLKHEEKLSNIEAAEKSANQLWEN